MRTKHSLHSDILDEKFITNFIIFLKENFKEEIKEENILIGKKTILIDTTLMDGISNIFRFEERSDNLELFEHCHPRFKRIYNHYEENSPDFILLYYL